MAQVDDTEEAEASETRAAGESDPRKWWIVAAMSLVIFLLTVDFYGIAVALPSIGRELGGSTTSLEWTVNAYMLGFASLLIAAGRISDLIGRRKVLLVGTVIFTAASIACGFARNPWFLVAARAVQGAGASMFFVTSLSIVSNAFSDKERGSGIGIWTAVGGIGSAVGPMIGGVLTQAASWRWFFFLNVPIAVGAILLTIAVVPETRDESAERLDVPGFLMVTAGFIGIVFGIEQSADTSWSSPIVLAPLLGGVALLVAFVLYERRASEPLVEFGLFRSRTFLGSSTVAFTGNFGFGAALVYITLYLQNILAYPPIGAGAIVLAFSVPFVLSSPFMGTVIKHLGMRVPMFVGMVVVCVAFALFALIGRTNWIGLVVIGLAVLGVGQGLAYNISTTAGMGAIDAQKAGEASGVLNTIRMMGLVFGVAITGAIFKAVENARLTGLIRGSGGLSPDAQLEVRGLLSGSAAAQQRLASFAPGITGQINGIVRSAFVSALIAGMILCLAISAVGAVAALFVRDPATSGEE